MKGVSWSSGEDRGRRVGAGVEVEVEVEVGGPGGWWL